MKAVKAALFCLLVTTWSAAGALTLSLDSQAGDKANAATMVGAIGALKNGAKRGLDRSLELRFLNQPRLFSADWNMTVEATYPNGDFYYLIGDLSDQWTNSDFQRFYSVAKWLSERGFRVIINPIAFQRDVREAVQNPRTSSIIWNSHGAQAGYVLDSVKAALPRDIFLKDRSVKLKYVLFANCYGQASGSYYGLRDSGVKSFGWEGTVTSDDLFSYLFGTDFDRQLASSLNIVIGTKPQTDI